MEMESEDGSRIGLRGGSKTVLGRGSGFETADRTVSRRHLILETDRQEGPSPRASFQVIGKNPVWVRRKEDNGIRVFRRSEKGKLAVGDWFCVAGHQPVWFSLKGVEIDKDDDDGGNERDSDSYNGLAESVDVSSDIDHVKELGFLVIGHEFDRYPKQMLRQVKDWEWFLEEGSKNIDSDDDGEKKVKRSNKRKKRGRDKGHGDAEDNDEDWMSDSEDERMDDLEKVNKVQERKYSTRSNDPRRKGGIKKNPSPTQKRHCGSRDEQEDDDDDTLGGFIVKDDDAEVDEPSDVEEEDEEEELVEEDDDDD